MLEAIPKVVPSNRDSQLDLQMPISIHLDHLHNVFIAAGTLACAVIIVIITVRHGVLVPSVMHSDLVISRFSMTPLSFCTATHSESPVLKFLVPEYQCVRTVITGINQIHVLQIFVPQ